MSTSSSVWLHASSQTSPLESQLDATAVQLDRHTAPALGWAPQRPLFALCPAPSFESRHRTVAHLWNSSRCQTSTSWCASKSSNTLQVGPFGIDWPCRPTRPSHPWPIWFLSSLMWHHCGSTRSQWLGRSPVHWSTRCMCAWNCQSLEQTWLRCVGTSPSMSFARCNYQCSNRYLSFRCRLTSLVSE